MRPQCMTLTLGKGVLVFHLSGQEDVYIDFGSSNRGLKAPSLSLRLAMQMLVVDVMHFSQVEMPMSVGEALWFGGAVRFPVLPRGLINQEEH